MNKPLNILGSDWCGQVPIAGSKEVHDIIAKYNSWNNKNAVQVSEEQWQTSLQPYISTIGTDWTKPIADPYAVPQPNQFNPYGLPVQPNHQYTIPEDIRKQMEDAYSGCLFETTEKRDQYIRDSYARAADILINKLHNIPIPTTKADEIEL